MPSKRSSSDCVDYVPALCTHRPTPGPGDEASADAQGVLFRRGKAYVRLIANPDARTEPDRLLAEAARVDRAILEGMGRGL